MPAEPSFHPPDVLVLAAGGILGEAWMTGVLAGIEASTGVDFRDTESLVGTSAGAIIACSPGVRARAAPVPAARARRRGSRRTLAARAGGCGEGALLGRDRPRRHRRGMGVGADGLPGSRGADAGAPGGALVVASRPGSCGHENAVLGYGVRARSAGLSSSSPWARAASAMRSRRTPADRART